ncbi:MAG: fumarylacetoacetate hydrolase family protein [Sulfolobales archaeon]
MRIVYFSTSPRETPRLGIYFEDKIIDLVESYREVFSAKPPQWFYDLGSFLENDKYSFKIVEEILSTYSRSVIRESALAHDSSNIIYHPLTSEDQRIFCIALNYRHHVAETGRPLPARPYVFMKTKSALIGHRQPIVISKASSAADHEIELGVVIGRRGKYIERNKARDHIAGFTVFNDISFRDWQMRFQEGLGMDWLHGKNMDSSTPVGPYLVTIDEIKDPYSLELILKVNGEIRQKGYTSDMIFSIEEIIEYISQGIKLLPGDLIATGTPAGVGHAKKIYLKEGDLIEAYITSIGTLINPVAKEI